MQVVLAHSTSRVADGLNRVSVLELMLEYLPSHLFFSHSYPRESNGRDHSSKPRHAKGVLHGPAGHGKHTDPPSVQFTQSKSGEDNQICDHFDAPATS